MGTPFPEVRRVEPDEVKRWVDAGDEVVIVDVRPVGAYAARHISGAQAIPGGTLKPGTPALPRDRQIVFY